MLKAIYSGSIDYMQIMDENGTLDSGLVPKGLTDQMLVEMYKKMSFARALDAKTLSLQRQGRAVTYAPLVGEEAVQIGSASAMRQGDIFVPSFRQHGVYLTRGLPLEKFFIYWRGFEEGGAIPKEVNGLPVIVPVGTQVPHSAGIAYAQKYKKTGTAVIVYVGDGGTSEGDFYEAINFAGVFKLPLVVIIENNQWAISVPRAEQTAAQTLTQKAVAAGIGSMQVDGNDVVAVYKATRDAIESARSGKPYVIECLTYRMSMHTTSDDPTKYREDSEVEAWKKRDPIARLGAYLRAKGLWDDSKESALKDEQLKRIDEALAKADEFKPNPDSIFENVYSHMPKTLEEQLENAKNSNYWQ